MEQGLLSSATGPIITLILPQDCTRQCCSGSALSRSHCSSVSSTISALPSSSVRVCRVTAQSYFTCRPSPFLVLLSSHGRPAAIKRCRYAIMLSSMRATVCLVLANALFSYACIAASTALLCSSLSLSSDRAAVRAPLVSSCSRHLRRRCQRLYFGPKSQKLMLDARTMDFRAAHTAFIAQMSADTPLNARCPHTLILEIKLGVP